MVKNFLDGRSKLYGQSGESWAVLFHVKFNYFNSKWNTILMYTKYYLVQTN